MKIFDVVPGWAWLLLVLACLAVAGAERDGRLKAKVATAAARAEFADYKAVQAESGRLADKAERQKERDREDELRRIRDQAQHQVAAADVAADRAAAAGRRLRDQFATAQLYVRAGACAAPAAGSPPTDTAAGVLADVRRRLDEAEDGTIRFADRGRISGLACERAYDTLTPAAAAAPSTRPP